MRGGGTFDAQFWQWLIYAVFTPSVNVFVLISGYFLCKSKLKIKKIIIMWIQVLFYSLVPYLVARFVFNVNFQNGIIYMMFPLTNNIFWFFTTYILMYLLMPFLNIILQHAKKNQLQCLIVGSLILCWLMHFKIYNIVGLNLGYTLLWFIILYIVGGYIRNYPIKIKKIFIFIIYAIATIGIWLFAVYKNHLWEWAAGSVVKDTLIKLIINTPEYISPLVVVSSVCLLLLFKDVTIKTRWIHKIICFISSCCFGIYLFHTSYFSQTLYTTMLKLPTYYTKPFPALNVLWFAAQLFIVSLVVEILRKVICKIFMIIILKIKKLKNDKKSKT